MMKKVVNKLIQESIKGCDVYHHNDSVWVIFTNTKEWIVELAYDDALWYNYDFFNNLFKYVSLNVVENQRYISKFFNIDTIGGYSVPNHRTVSIDTINIVIKDGVKSSFDPDSLRSYLFLPFLEI